MNSKESKTFHDMCVKAAEYAKDKGHSVVILTLVREDDEKRECGGIAMVGGNDVAVVGDALSLYHLADQTVQGILKGKGIHKGEEKIKDSTQMVDGPGKSNLW